MMDPVLLMLMVNQSVHVMVNGQDVIVQVSKHLESLQDISQSERTGKKSEADPNFQKGGDNCIFWLFNWRS